MLIYNVQEGLKKLLQRDVQFMLNKKTLREGKLLLFNVKDFYIHFLLQTTKIPQKNYELPMPFDIGISSTQIHFDYSIKKVLRGNLAQELLATSLIESIGKKSKFYDNILTINFQ